MEVSIRPYQNDDVNALYAAAKESAVELQPFMPWRHPDYRIDESRSWIDMQVTRFRAGDEYQFVVSGENKFLGGCGLNAIDQENRRANLGYWIRSSETRKGAATEAVCCLVRWALENTNLNRFEIVVSTHNLASLRVAEKAGALREGILRSRLLLYGVVHDAVVFSFVRKDLENQAN
jgi:ribosomal-protein-serine acetyltransferase